MDGNSTWKSALTVLLAFAFFAGAFFAAAPTVGTVYVSGYNATGQVVFASFELAGGDPNVTSCHYNPRIGVAGWHLMNEYNNLHMLCYDANADLHEAPSLSTIRVQATNANGTGESPSNVTLDNSPPSTCDVSAIDELSAYAYVTGTTIYYNNASAGDFNVTVDAVDDDSGIYYINFPGTVSNGDYAYSVPYLLTYSWTENSTATYDPATAICYDNMRVNNDTTTFSVILDNTAPVVGTVSIVPSYFNGSMRYVSILSNISATASDSGSGINESSCEYYTDGSTWTAADGYTGGECYANGVDTSAASEINMRVWDNVNNSDTDNGTPVIVDANAPTTTPSAVTEDGSTYTESTWTNSTYVNVTLTCDDSAENDSGCNITYYCTDTSDVCTPTTVYNETVQITTEGTSYIRFLSVDQVGNAETANSFTVQIDTTAPTTTATGVIDDGSAYTFGEWSSSTYVNVTLTCDDGTDSSGCDTTLYCLYNITDAPCTPDTVYTTPVMVDTENGTNITFSSNDTVNNVETAHSEEVDLDWTGPFFSSFVVDPIYDNGTANYTQEEASIRIDVFDYQSGVNGSTCEYTIDGGSTWTAGTWTGGYRCYADFINTTTASVIGFRLSDNLGNPSTSDTITVLVDLNDPNTTADGNGYTFSTWTNSPPVAVNLTCTDSQENDSGCNITYYCIDTDGTCSPYSMEIYNGTSIMVSNENVTYVNFMSVDNVYHHESDQGVQIWIDTVPPTVAIQSPTSRLYNTNTTEVNYTAEDITSGVDFCWYEVDGGANSTPSATCDNATVADLGEGNHTIIVYANDSAGNIGSASVGFFVDTIAPTVGAITIVPLYNDGSINWISGLSAISAPVSDGGSGINSTSCVFTKNSSYAWYMDGSAYNGSHCVFTDVNTSASVTGGVEDINVGVYDIAGNLGLGTEVNVTPDETAPATVAAGVDSAGNAYTFGTWTNESVLVNLTCTDAESGCNITYYCVDDVDLCTPNETYSSAFLVSPGVTSTWYARFNSIDNVGNEEVENSETMMFDMTPPTVAIQSPTSRLYNTNTTDLNYTSTDSDSGVDSCWWSDFYGGGALINCSNTTLSDIPEGNDTVRVYSNDSVGNVAYTDVSFYVDTIAPTVGTVTVAPLYNNGGINWISGITNISAPVSDGGSGINTTSCLYTTNSSKGWYRDASAYNGSHCVFTNVNTSGSVFLGIQDINVNVADLAGNQGFGTEVNVSSDEIAPTTTATAVDVLGNPYTFSTWTNDTVTVNLTCTDNQSGCNKTMYGLYYGTSCPAIDRNYTDPVAVGGEGVIAMCFYSVDQLGNTEANTTEQIWKDMSAPSIAISSPTTRVYNGSNINLNYAVSDSLSGVNTCWYDIDAGNATIIASCANTTIGGMTQGNHTVTVYVNDSVNNINSSSVTFTVDTTAPTTTADAGAYTFGTWTNESVTVTLDCTDAVSGCDKTLYCTDTTNNCTPSTVYGADGYDTEDVGAISISTEGVSYIRYRSNDTAGNLESIKNSTIKIDTAAPSTAATAVMGNGSAYTFGDWASWNATVTLTCSDASSGCNRTLYCVDTTNNCTPSTTYTAPVLIDDEGTNYIRYYSTDNVSNTEATKNQTVNVYLAPILAFTASPELYTPNKANYFEISYLAMNRSTARLTVDGRNYTMTCNDTHCWTTVTVRKGLHTYQAWMTDASSRTGNTSTFNFTVDYTPPRAYYTSLSVRNGGTVGATGFFQARYYEINLKNATVYFNDTTANTTSSYGMTCETGGLRLCNLTLTSTDDDGFGLTSGGELIIGHTYRYYITVFDLADNYRTLKLRRFTVVGSP